MTDKRGVWGDTMAGWERPGLAVDLAGEVDAYRRLACAKLTLHVQELKSGPEECRQLARAFLASADCQDLCALLGVPYTRGIVPLLEASRDHHC
jgi:hypothetical protein